MTFFLCWIDSFSLSQYTKNIVGFCENVCHGKLNLWNETPSFDLLLSSPIVVSHWPTALQISRTRHTIRDTWSYAQRRQDLESINSRVPCPGLAWHIALCIIPFELQSAVNIWVFVLLTLQYSSMYSSKTWEGLTAIRELTRQSSRSFSRLTLASISTMTSTPPSACTCYLTYLRHNCHFYNSHSYEVTSDYTVTIHLLTASCESGKTKIQCSVIKE